jgi:hypothetical protein
MATSTIESIDTHLTRIWLKLREAQAKGRPTTEFRQILDNLLDERTKYTQETA